jgi:hypothetical protein
LSTYREREAERRELLAAGWEPVERMGKVVWRRPESGYLCPQDVAIILVRKHAEAAGEPRPFDDSGWGGKP